MSDEGFHEIQLNGKQLVFLFMAATVVSVVIFLCGVMVGRGVRDRTVSAAAPEASAPQEANSASADIPPAPVTSGPAATTGTSPGQPVTQQTASVPPPDQAPPPAIEEDDYYDDLVKDPKARSLEPAKSRTPAAPAAVKTPERPAAKIAPSDAAATKPPAVAAAKPPAAAAAPERASASPGYAVQLVAVRERSEADAIARRLVSKGYQAYVLVPQPGKPPVYRVQVGRFKNRGEADKIASRLRKDEQFKPWVTR